MTEELINTNVGWDEVATKREGQIAEETVKASDARNAIKDSQSKGKPPTRPDLEARGEAETNRADLSEAQRQAQQK